MAGCPNRCKHCWLGVTPNGRLHLNDLEYVADSFRPYTDALEVSSWYREPDYLDNYRELYDAECRLSTVHTPHFELMSFYRAVRDTEYVPWLRSLNVTACQLTLFGGERTTDDHYGRKGAFSEIMRTADLLLSNGIAPRFQIFIHQKNADEMALLEELFSQKGYAGRTEDMGREFVAFVHQGSCEGKNEKLYDVRVTPEEVSRLPDSLARSTLKHFQKQNLFEVFGQTEGALCRDFESDDSTRGFATDSPVFLVDKDYCVYPNITAPAQYWCLGNLKAEGCHAILDRYANNNSTAQHIAKTVPVRDMAKACGNKTSRRLFTKGDYYLYLLNRYCKIGWEATA
jgi:MoaA/NifB/PqqE/SkfB family radical SAM enzyme